MHQLVYTSEDRERGTVRVRDEMLDVVKHLYESLLKHDPQATIRITLKAEPPPGPYG